MSRNRSSAYWSANRYSDEAVEPAPTAPLQDLPAAAAARFKLLRASLTYARRKISGKTRIDPKSRIPSLG